MKYVNAEDFKDFKQNFSTMVNVFNHSVTAIREDSKSTRKVVEKIGNEFGDIKVDLAIVKQKNHTNNWMIKWILGIIASLIVAGVVGIFLPVS